MDKKVKELVEKGRSELECRPLSTIDTTLEAFSGCVTEEDRSALLNLFFQAVLKSKGITDSDPVNYAFNKDLSYEDKRFISACLLRLLSVYDKCFEDISFRIKAFEIFDKTISNDLYPKIGLDTKSQTYEKESKMKSVLPQIESELDGVISSLNSLDVLSNFRQRYMQKLNYQLTKITIYPFIATDLLNVRMDEYFNAVEEYIEKRKSNNFQDYEEAINILTNYLSETEQFGTMYCKKFLGEPAKKILELIQNHMENDPASKPAKLVVDKTEKRYPFNDNGNRFNLSLNIQNVGTGYAFDVFLAIETTTDLELEKPDLFLGSLEPNSKVIAEIPVRVIKSSMSVYAEVKLTWTNYDHNTSQYEVMLEFGGQNSKIDWDALSVTEPYTLEAVETKDELVGRKEILNQLMARVQAQSVGSSYVVGQKRVGKTSVIKTLKTCLSAAGLSDYFVLYFDRGDYIRNDPTNTVTTLGRRMCTSIIKADKRFNQLVAPEFADALSPLSEFLELILEIVPTYRILFILDEFDELPLELYRRGPIGDAFFATIRTVSSKMHFGFVLAGSENMEHIMNFQGHTLNKFQAIKLDYFDRNQYWVDFKELVQRPVEGILELSDDALIALYEQTSGNPFFTKLICNRLFSMMVGRRDSHVTRTEIQRAVKLVLNLDLAMNKLSHFWTDGILDIGSKFEAISINRKRVLLCLAEAFRTHGLASKDTILKLGQSSYGMDNELIENELREFQRRQVLVEKNGNYDCRVPLFRNWLIENGVNQIITTFSDLDEILKQKRREEDLRIRSEEVVSLVNGWPVYKGARVSEDKVRAWLNQFGDNSNQRLIFQILLKMTFYSSHNIRQKMKEAHGIVVRGLVHRVAEGKRKRSDILVSYLDGPGKSGSQYARIYTDENDIYTANIVEYSKLGESIKQTQGLQAVVFVDDFIGSGNSISEYFEKINQNFGEIIKQSKLQYYFVAISGFQKALEKIENTLTKLQLDVKLHICDPLDESAKAFSDNSLIFSNAEERNKAKNICYQHGIKLVKNAPLGYGDCQATVVFENSCPNNALPIIWSDSKDWTPLFKRL